MITFKLQESTVQTEKLSEKEKQKRVEESDFQNTTSLFSGLSTDNKVNLDQPKDERDFQVLATTLAEKVRAFEVSYY